MVEAFDPYHKWLGISPADQPPNHYRLLGIDLFESDPEVISAAAFRQTAHVRTYQLGPHSILSQRLLNEVAVAKICLLDPVRKAEYDRRLRKPVRTIEDAEGVEAEPPDWEEVLRADKHAPFGMAEKAEIGELASKPRPSPPPISFKRPVQKSGGFLFRLGLVLAVSVVALAALVLSWPKRRGDSGGEAPSHSGEVTDLNPLPQMEWFDIRENKEDERDFRIESLSLADSSEIISRREIAGEEKGPRIARVNELTLPPGPLSAKAAGPEVPGGNHLALGVNIGRGQGLEQRGKGRRECLVGVSGGTGSSERAVAGGLNWLARHQSPAGNWSLQHTKNCRGGSCGGPGEIEADAAATAIALLAFQGAGQTHKANGPYQLRVIRGISWLLKHQNTRNGDLSAGAPQPMYSHALGTMALSEAYAMTRDEFVGAAATKAVRFIEFAQNEATGGWRYTPHEPGDTSVLGWQVAALKCAQTAGIGVNSMTLDGARRFLATVAQGRNRGLYAYQPRRDPTPAMVAVGMLCQQYLGSARDDPAMTEGKNYLLAHLPDPDFERNVYYWYYATLAMHNVMGAEWDLWNRQMRRVLITTQCKGGCAEGSWDAERPADTWGKAGRVYVTALSTLTLEVYYRYLPLFNINQRSRK